jgi:hypothetical protein
MKIANTAQIVLLICFKSFNLNAQTVKNENTDHILVGKWAFVKAVDINNVEVKYLTKDYKGPDGKEIPIVATGPDITINSDHTYVKKFTSVNSDIGHWKLVSNDEIEYEMVILKDSRQGNLIRQMQALYGKKWRTDSDGNFLDSSTDKLVSLTEDEMKVRYESKYVLIYKKN